jgi:predicted RNase H-like HicB family nuclease
MPIELTAVYREAPEGGYTAFVKEIPGANTQGETLDEARENLKDAVRLIIETNRMLAEEWIADAPVIREPFPIDA